MAQAALDAALAALQQNNLAEAERSARDAVAAAPRSAQTHNILGVVLDRQGRKDESVVQFNTAIGRDPNLVSARNNLGRILAERGKTKEAIAEFERVLKVDPGQAQAHYNLGVLYGEAGDFVNAAEHSRALGNQHRTIRSWHWRFSGRLSRQSPGGNESAATSLSAASLRMRALFALATCGQSKQYKRAARVFAAGQRLFPYLRDSLQLGRRAV